MSGPEEPRDGLSRRRLLQAGGVGAAGLALAGCGSKDGSGEPAPAVDRRESGATAAGRPRNVIVIVTDTTRADHLGAYGDDRGLTPNLDELAKASLLFERAHPEAMPTVPARRALLTGRRQFPFRYWQAEERLPQSPGWNSLDESAVTWPELLGAAEVTTAYVTDNPFLIGPRFTRVRDRFDHFRGFVGQAAFYSGRDPQKVAPSVIAPFLLDALRDTRQEDALNDYLHYNRPGRSEDEYLTAKLFRTAIGLLDQLRKDGPFALVVDAFDPHEPWDPPARWAKRFAGDAPDGIDPISPFVVPVGRVDDLDLSDDQVERVRGLYAADLAFVDHWIGNFLGAVADAGLLEDTTVVYLSDHGILLGERGWLGKVGSQVHREVSHVPFMIRDPDGRLAGERSGFRASTHDVAPTMLGALGVPVPGPMDGEDLGLLLDGHALDRPHATASYDSWVTYRDDDWLLIGAREDDRRRLYDLREDAEEVRDVAADHPDVVERLWQVIVDEAGGTLPDFGDDGVLGG